MDIYNILKINQVNVSTGRLGGNVIIKTIIKNI
jgi:hypothetical protein